jgi:hypothetical protein
VAESADLVDDLVGAEAVVPAVFERSQARPLALHDGQADDVVREAVVVAHAHCVGGVVGGAEARLVPALVARPADERVRVLDADEADDDLRRPTQRVGQLAHWHVGQVREQHAEGAVGVMALDELAQGFEVHVGRHGGG